MQKLALSINGNAITTVGNVPTGGTAELARVIQVGFEILIIIAILLSFLYIIWGGFDWITSEGEKQKLSQAQQKITFALIGLIFVFLSFLLITTFQHIFLSSSGNVPCGIPIGAGHVPC